jgi:hypothetical protein
MKQLHDDINIKNARMECLKKEEWQTKSAEYEQLISTADSLSCPYICNEMTQELEHDDKCEKCYLGRKARRIRINVHESLLPSESEMAAKVVLFELMLPDAFAAWRDATWFILRELARSPQPLGKPHHVLCCKYPQLQGYNHAVEANVVLASFTKSFLATHYSSVSFPVTLDKVILNHGLRYSLYDAEKSLWTAKVTQPPSFADLCTPISSCSSPFHALASSLHPTKGVTGLTSNEVIAWQTKCPRGMTVQEGFSFQELRLDYKSQWLRLLRELASPSLTFGQEAVSALVTPLTFQAGPRGEDESMLREAHWVFRDASFCDALLNQIIHRIDAGVANWRECDSVDCYVTILLRLLDLSTFYNIRSSAKALLQQIRKLSLVWTRQLRAEILEAKDAEVSKRRSIDVVNTALLTRRTFAVEAHDPSLALTSEDVALFFEVSIILKENLPEKLSSMPSRMRHRFIRDVKHLHLLEARLRQAVIRDNSILGATVNQIWATLPGGSARTFSTWTFQPEPAEFWVSATADATSQETSQRVHFNILTGALLINGITLGKLPTNFTLEEAFHQLFGNRIFWIWPSSLPGMQYVAASLVESHQVHFGTRNGKVITRLRAPGRAVIIYEHIPRAVSRGSDISAAPDLPLPLIDGCVHLLNIITNIMEVRPESEIWKQRFGNWSLNMQSRHATRNKSVLLDPRSKLFIQFASIFTPFESITRLLVFQGIGTLSVELPTLELSFKVLNNGLLSSHQLRAVICRDQDAGCLYSLRSKLVLSDSTIANNKSVLVT